MNIREARLRLSACRWVNEDRRDPYFAEALELAAREPELAQWWAAQRELDGILSRRLQEIHVPDALLRAVSGD